MIISKKQSLLTIILAVCSWGLQASEPERKTRAAEEPTGYLSRARRWFTGQPAQRTLRGEITESTRLPAAITDLISQYAEEYQPYEEITTFPIQKVLQTHPLLRLSEDGLMLTICFIEVLTIEVIVYSVIYQKEVNRFTIKNKGWGMDLRLSGNGKMLIKDNEVFDTLTGTKTQEIPNITWDTKEAKTIKYIPATLSHDGTILAFVPNAYEEKYPVILFNLVNRTQLILENTRTDKNDRKFVQFSRDGKTVACLNGDTQILLFDTDTGAIKKTVTIPSDVNLFTLNSDGSYIVYQRLFQAKKSQDIVLIDIDTDVQKKIAETYQSARGFSAETNIYAFGFTATDNLLYTISSRKSKLKDEEYFIEIRNVKDNVITDTIPLDHSHVPVFSDNDRYMAFRDLNSIRVFKKSTASEVAQEELEKKREQAKEVEMKKDLERLEQERRTEENKKLKPSGLTAAALQHIARTSPLPIEQVQQQALPQPQPAPLEPVVEEVDD